MEYRFRDIEKKWQQHWEKTQAYKVSNTSEKPKFYVLDMFPYPSGAGLHVGHPLGYIASDIYARFKRLKGFNVLHPMGYDAFGLPAEQYAIEHGVHPAISTEQNINNFRKQMDNIGFCFDWSRELRTSDPAYYKWTQWIFLQLFKSWFNPKANKAESITTLIGIFENEGSQAEEFTAADWKNFTEKRKQEILMGHRLAYCGIGEVNWCEALGTVLANDEVVNGVSERGGYPVVKKKLRQWYLRITDYADRLLEGLETVEFSDAMKEMQTNWIGKSIGAEIQFPLSISPRRGEEMEEIGAKLKRPGFGYPDYKVDSEMSFENAKRMRREPTEAESILWSALRSKQTGYKFRRQHPVENYIADFICLDVWLAIEVDGGYHTTVEQKEADDIRDSRLKELGFTTLRFTNEEVINKIDIVVETIQQKATELKKTLPPKTIGGPGPSPLQGEAGERVTVFTTRPDTIFGVDFMVVAPEHELIEKIVPANHKLPVEEYITYVKSRSERERIAEKKITGCFTGAYALNPFNGREIPIWISEYVLAGYGTGAIMGVPCGDERDHKFAKHFNIPITNIIGNYYNGEEANATKDAILENSDFLNGMVMRDAIGVVIGRLEDREIGERKVNYKMRDAAFSRQRYWGEPFPIQWKDGVAIPLPESELPLLLPEVDSYSPGPDGEGPLANIPEWVARELETNTMPGYAGSSWYFLRYMDPDNKQEFCNRKVSDYWNQVDLYIGGTEHAVGHLLYSRMWTKCLYDLGLIGFDEPYKKLMNQGMIQGSSRFIYRISWLGVFKPDFDFSKLPIILVSKNFRNSWVHGEKESIEKINDEVQKVLKNAGITSMHTFSISELHVDVNIVDGVELDIEAFKKWRNGEYSNAEFILEDGSVYAPLSPGEPARPSHSDGGLGVRSTYICGVETEKMSKSKFNTVNPDTLVEKYGADTFRMYEMFLGPVEQSKPWDTKGIEGVHRFLKKLWRLFYDEVKGKIWNDGKATDAELKVLHKTIKKIEEDTERFSFNTAVSAFMICVNELSDLKCYKKEILEPLVIMLTPYAPHIAAELYAELAGGEVINASFPKFEAKYVAESSKEYPVSINGKVRTNITISLDVSQQEVETIALANETVQKWLEGKTPKKIIFVKGKMINIVI